MFTGIIHAIGQIKSVSLIDTKNSVHDIYVWIEAGNLDLTDVKIGDSISIQGVCMTIVEKNLTSQSFAVNVSAESLNSTVSLNCLDKVNLEKALRATDFLGGHLVSGHIDSIGTVTNFIPVGKSYKLYVQVPITIKQYLIYKGSITINGVSLTINQINNDKEKCIFIVNIIPYTMEHTTLNKLQKDTLVNLEVDMIARYVKHYLDFIK